MSSARVTPTLLLGTGPSSATRAEPRQAGGKTGSGEMPLPPHVQVWEVVDPGTPNERRVPWTGEFYPVQQA